MLDARRSLHLLRNRPRAPDRPLRERLVSFSSRCPSYHEFRGTNIFIARLSCMLIHIDSNYSVTQIINEDMGMVVDEPDIDTLTSVDRCSGRFLFHMTKFRGESHVLSPQAP